MNLYSESCPPEGKRRAAMETWTCDEIDKYYKLEQIRIIVNYVTMGPQVLIFIGLIVLLIRKKCFSTGQVPCMSILICVFVLLNGVFSIVRANENFLDFYAEEDDYDIYQITYGFESICFIGAVWFYGIIYYQTARDIKRLIIFSCTPASTPLTSPSR